MSPLTPAEKVSPYNEHLDCVEITSRCKFTEIHCWEWSLVFGRPLRGTNYCQREQKLFL